VICLFPIYWTVTTSFKVAKAYRFLSVIAGDLPLYEEALRALYQSDQKKFITAMKSWPEAISSYALALTGTLFSKK
jgi:hypothetical protein